jgi:hypothetical protein
MVISISNSRRNGIDLKCLTVLGGSLKRLLLHSDLALDLYDEDEGGAFAIEQGRNGRGLPRLLKLEHFSLDGVPDLALLKAMRGSAPKTRSL